MIRYYKTMTERRFVRFHHIFSIILCLNCFIISKVNCTVNYNKINNEINNIMMDYNNNNNINKNEHLLPFKEEEETKCKEFNETCKTNKDCCPEYWCVRLTINIIKGICLPKRQQTNTINKKTDIIKKSSIIHPEISKKINKYSIINDRLTNVINKNENIILNKPDYLKKQVDQKDKKLNDFNLFNINYAKKFNIEEIELDLSSLKFEDKDNKKHTNNDDDFIKNRIESIYSDSDIIIEFKNNQHFKQYEKQYFNNNKLQLNTELSKILKIETEYTSSILGINENENIILNNKNLNKTTKFPFKSIPEYFSSIINSKTSDNNDDNNKNKYSQKNQKSDLYFDKKEENTFKSEENSKLYDMETYGKGENYLPDEKENLIKNYEKNNINQQKQNTNYKNNFNQNIDNLETDIYRELKEKSDEDNSKIVILNETIEQVLPNEEENLIKTERESYELHQILYDEEETFEQNIDNFEKEINSVSYPETIYKDVKKLDKRLQTVEKTFKNQDKENAYKDILYETDLIQNESDLIKPSQVEEISKELKIYNEKTNKVSELLKENYNIKKIQLIPEYSIKLKEIKEKDKLKDYEIDIYDSKKENTKIKLNNFLKNHRLRKILKNKSEKSLLTPLQIKEINLKERLNKCVNELLLKTDKNEENNLEKVVKQNEIRTFIDDSVNVVKLLENKVIELDTTFNSCLNLLEKLLEYVTNNHNRIPRSEVSHLKGMLEFIRQAIVDVRNKMSLADHTFKECLHLIKDNIRRFQYKKNRILEGYFLHEEEAVKNLEEIEKKIKEKLEKQICHFEMERKSYKENQGVQTYFSHEKMEEFLKSIKSKIVDFYRETRRSLRRYLRTLKGDLDKRGYYKKNVKTKKPNRGWDLPSNDDDKIYKKRERIRKKLMESEKIFTYVTSSEENEAKNATETPKDPDSPKNRSPEFVSPTISYVSHFEKK
ncbi:uncharacterized protein LOC142330168 [Lycorma delicatula]|uniref:uncharacterized protein LOC142330168 n=1 Tax=Lycorma delicatula TaxID=130591 RepID=UPI003F510785